jgi:hypothetical protein
MTDFISTELAKFNVSDAVIAQMRQQYIGLTISGLNDKEGYKQVKDARLMDFLGSAVNYLRYGDPS